MKKKENEVTSCVCDTANHFVAGTGDKANECVCEEKFELGSGDNANKCIPVCDPKCGENYVCTVGTDKNECVCPKDGFKEEQKDGKKECVANGAFSTFILAILAIILIIA